MARDTRKARAIRVRAIRARATRARDIRARVTKARATRVKATRVVRAMASIRSKKSEAFFFSPLCIDRCCIVPLINGSFQDLFFF